MGDLISALHPQPTLSMTCLVGVLVWSIPATSSMFPVPPRLFPMAPSLQTTLPIGPEMEPWSPVCPDYQLDCALVGTCFAVLMILTPTFHPSPGTHTSTQRENALEQNRMFFRFPFQEIEHKLWLTNWNPEDRVPTPHNGFWIRCLSLVLGGWAGRFGWGGCLCWGVGLLCCENMERHRQAKAHDNEEGSGEMGTDFGASKTLGRVVKASACQADGLCPRGFESHRCRCLHCMLGQMFLPRATFIEPRTFAATTVLSNI